MAQRGRKPGFRMTEEHRDKIRYSNILSCLIEHVRGNRDMSSTQVTAAIALLRKVMSDLSAATLADEDGGPLAVTVKQYVVPIAPIPETDRQDSEGGTQH